MGGAGEPGQGGAAGRAAGFRVVQKVEPQDLQTRVAWRPEKQGEKRQRRADWGRKGREDRCGGA